MAALHRRRREALRGDLTGANDALQRLEQRARACAAAIEPACIIFGLAAALEGEVADAHSEMKMALAVAVETGIPWFECLARIALAQIQTDGADRRGVEAQLRAAERIARTPAQPMAVIRSGACRSQCGRAPATGARRWSPCAPRSGRGTSRGFASRSAACRGRSPSSASLALDNDVEPEFARALVRDGKLAPATPPLRVSRWPWPFRIMTFGGFQLPARRFPRRALRQGPGRPMELLKVLVALGRHNVRADQLADALWPHMEADYAHKSFTATLHRLRRMLDDDDALVSARRPAVR